MSELMYVGANLPASIGTRDIIIKITEDNIEDYFTITNGTYTFVGSEGVFTSNNKGKSSSTAQITLVAKQAISNFSLDYTYSTEASYDKFTFTYNSTIKANAVSGIGSGNFSQALASGDTLIFKYVKDSSQDKNKDICTFYNIQFTTTETYDILAKDNAAKVVAAAYIGVNDVAKKVEKAYIGVNGVAQMCYKKAIKTYTVKIDQSNSNPETCCTYADDAVGMTKGSSDWDDIFGYKPCIMKDGVVVGYLNPNNFTQYEDGSSAPITDTTYDVMIEFPRRGLNISTSGDIITISLTDGTNSEEFNYLAHKRGSTQKDYFYLGAYSATGSSSKVGSNSGLAPLVSTTLTNFITYAHNRGTGYEIMGFYQWTYVQALYILKYGNLNSQAALGKGYTSGSAAQTTGYCNAKGMCYGNTNSGTDRVKLFGLEDLWGNVYQWISGLYCDSSYNLLTTTDNFGTNTAASNWEYSVSSGISSNTYGYATKLQGTNNGGFVLKANGGSTTTYWCDSALLDSGYFPYVGGRWGGSDGAGVFYCYVNASVSFSYSNIGSRLMYL